MDRNTFLYQDGLQYSNDSNHNRCVKMLLHNWIELNTAKWIMVLWMQLERISIQEGHAIEKIWVNENECVYGANMLQM